MSQHVFAFRHPTGALTLVGHSHTAPPQDNPPPGCVVEVYKDRLAFLFEYLSSGPWVTFVDPGSRKVLDVYPTETAALDALADVMTPDWEKVIFPTIREYYAAQGAALGLVKDGKIVGTLDLDFLHDGMAVARRLGATDIQWFPNKDALWVKRTAHPSNNPCYGILKGDLSLFGPYWSIDAPEVQAAFTLDLPVLYFPSFEDFSGQRLRREALLVHRIMHHPPGC